MPYNIRRNDGAIAKAVRRIALEQIERALFAVKTEEQAENLVAELGLRAGKLTGVVSLIGPVLARRARADTLIEGWTPPADADLASALRAGLKLLDNNPKAAKGEKEFARLRRDLVEAIDAPAPAMSALRDDWAKGLRKSRSNVKTWSLAADGWDALEPGLAATLAQTANAIGTLDERCDVAAFRDLAAAVRDHHCHARLLRKIDPAAMHARIEYLTRLLEVLQALIDLCTFREIFADDERFSARRGTREVLVVLASRQAAVLRDDIRQNVKTLKAKYSRPLLEKWRGDWRAWRG